jgi:hypothetical protein
MTTNWIHIALGFWIIISPWILDFSNILIIRWSNAMIGAAIVIINMWAIFGESKRVKPEADEHSL